MSQFQGFVQCCRIQIGDAHSFSLRLSEANFLTVILDDGDDDVDDDDVPDYPLFWTN